MALRCRISRVPDGFCLVGSCEGLRARSLRFCTQKIVYINFGRKTWSIGSGLSGLQVLVTGQVWLWA